MTGCALAFRSLWIPETRRGICPHLYESLALSHVLQKGEGRDSKRGKGLPLPASMPGRHIHLLKGKEMATSLRHERTNAFLQESFLLRLPKKEVFSSASTKKLAFESKLYLQTKFSFKMKGHPPLLKERERERERERE